MQPGCNTTTTQVWGMPCSRHLCLSSTLTVVHCVVCCFCCQESELPKELQGNNWVFVGTAATSASSHLHLRLLHPAQHCPPPPPGPSPRPWLLY